MRSHCQHSTRLSFVQHRHQDTPLTVIIHSFIIISYFFRYIHSLIIIIISYCFRYIHTMITGHGWWYYVSDLVRAVRMTSSLLSLMIIIISCHQQASAQSSFSPFSLLGSLFNPQPQSRPRVDRPRQQRHQAGQHPQQQLFRAPPHPGLKFSASQVRVTRATRVESVTRVSEVTCNEICVTMDSWNRITQWEIARGWQIDVYSLITFCSC